MLRNLYEKVQLKRNIQNKYQECLNQKEKLSIQLSDYQKKFRKEVEDVERLETGVLSRFFYELMGSADQKLEKERKEAYEAKSRLETVKYQLNAVEDDIVRYKNQLKELENCEEEYKNAYHQKLNQLKDKHIDIVEIENEITESRCRQKEIKEAILEGEKAHRIANQAYDALNSADGWATFDVFGGGLISDIAKYDRLDTAQALINDLQIYLSRFKTELADVSIHSDIQVEIGEFLRLADYWFDNIFTDWAVKDRISNALNQIETTLTQINQVLKRLDELLAHEIQKENELKEKLELMVVNTDGEL